MTATDKSKRIWELERELSSLRRHEDAAARIQAREERDRSRYRRSTYGAGRENGGGSMKAAQAAMEAIRHGTPPGLAIYLAARDYGTSTKTVVKAMRAKKSPPLPPKDTSDAWWNR